MSLKRQPKAFSTESESSDDENLSLESDHADAFSGEEEVFGNDHVYSAFKNSFLSINLSSSTPSSKTTTTTKLKGDDLIKSKISQSHPIKSPNPITTATTATTATTTTPTPLASNCSNNNATNASYIYPKLRKINADTTIYPTLFSVITDKSLEEEYQNKKLQAATTPLACPNKSHNQNKDETSANEKLLMKNLRDALDIPETKAPVTPTTTSLACHSKGHNHNKDEKEKQVIQNLRDALGLPETKATVTPTTTQLACPNNNNNNNFKDEIREKDNQMMKNLSDALEMPEMKVEMPNISFSSTSTNSKVGEEKKDYQKRFTFEGLDGVRGGGEKSVPLSQGEKKNFGLTERLATQMLFEDQIQNSEVKSLMSMGKYAPIGNRWGSSSVNKPCQKTEVMTHIRQFHNEFYQLLFKQNLVETVKNRIPGVVIVIPNREALLELDPTSEETRSILLYHVLITGGISIQEVDGMLRYETLAGDYVQVESSNGVHYINGLLLVKPDVNCLFSIYHVDRVMDRLQVMEIDENPNPPEDLPPELPSDSSVDDQGGEEGGEEYQEEGLATKIETRFISSRINAAPRFLNSNNNNNNSLETKLPLLQALTRGMNQQFFSAPIELPEHLVSLQSGQPQKSEIIISTFPTTELFRAYESNRMLDISRVKVSSRFQLSFSADQHHHLGEDKGGLQLTQYVCPGGSNKEIRKMELSRGLLAVSLNSLDGKGFRMMLCKMDCTKDDGNCYVSQDENLLLRFHEDKLESITVNHAGLADLPIVDSPLQEKSFLEYSLKPDLYKSHMTRGQFDVMLLSQGKIGRWIKKQTQKGIRKTRCGVKRLEAINLKPVPNSYIQSFLVDKVNPQMDESKAQSVSVTINLFDKACRPLDNRSTEAKRYSVETKNGDPVIVHKLDISFSDESHLSRNTELFDRHHMIEIQVGAQKKISIHLHGVNRKSTLYSYYGLLGLDLFVFTFDSNSGRLQYIYAMRASTHIARKIIASKV